jgi:hypothetical protein
MARTDRAQVIRTDARPDWARAAEVPHGADRAKVAKLEATAVDSAGALCGRRDTAEFYAISWSPLLKVADCSHKCDEIRCRRSFVKFLLPPGRLAAPNRVPASKGRHRWVQSFFFFTREVPCARYAAPSRANLWPDELTRSGTEYRRSSNGHWRSRPVHIFARISLISVQTTRIISKVISAANVPATGRIASNLSSLMDGSFMRHTRQLPSGRKFSVPAQTKEMSVKFPGRK